MTDYTNKKLKKSKAKEKARKAKQARRSKAIKAENRQKKEIERIKWQNRPRTAPFKKESQEDSGIKIENLENCNKDRVVGKEDLLLKQLKKLLSCLP